MTRLARPVWFFVDQEAPVFIKQEIFALVDVELYLLFVEKKLPAFLELIQKIRIGIDPDLMMFGHHPTPRIAFPVRFRFRPPCAHDQYPFRKLATFVRMERPCSLKLVPMNHDFHRKITPAAMRDFSFPPNFFQFSLENGGMKMIG